jgi:hypothetical protein
MLLIPILIQFFMVDMSCICNQKKVTIRVKTRLWGCSLAEHVVGMYEALGSITSITPQKPNPNIHTHTHTHTIVLFEFIMKILKT